MGVTIVEQLFQDGDSPPTAEYIRQIGLSDRNNLIRPVRGETDGSIFVSPGESARDPFARSRISAPFGIFDSKQLYVKDQILMIESLSGGATSTYVTNDASVRLTLPVTNGASAIRQSKVNIPYQPGRSTLSYLTGVMGAPKANVRQRWGLFDTNDGVFWEQTTSGLSVVRRTSVSGSPVDNVVPQASWNLDTLDGLGPSGLTLDPSMMNLYVIDLAWLGVGGARLGVLFDGHLIYCHKFETANQLTTVFIKTPALPIRYEIVNTGTAASDTSLLQTCCAAFSEGGLDPIGFPVVATNGVATRTIGAGVTVPMVATRLRSGFHKGFLIPLEISAAVLTPDDLYYELIVGGTLTGGAWVDAGIGSEVNVSATSLSGGLVVQAGYLSENAGSATEISRGRIGATGDQFTGLADIITLTLASISTAADAGATLTLQEVL